MIEWWLSSFFKDDKCDSGKDGRKSLVEYLEQKKKELSEIDIDEKQKIKDDLESIVNVYIENAKDVGILINSYDVIRNINIPAVSELKICNGGLYFKFKGFECSVTTVGSIYIY